MAIDVTKLPAPGKSGGGFAPADSDSDEDAYGNDEDKAAEVSQCQDILDAIKSGDAEAFCDKLKDFLATQG